MLSLLFFKKNITKKKRKTRPLTLVVFAIYPLSSLGSHCAAISIRLVSIKKQCFCLLDLKIVFKKATLVLHSWIRLKEWGKVFNLPDFKNYDKLFEFQMCYSVTD